jgi:hypothetical protein
MAFDRAAFVANLRASYPGITLEDAERAAARMAGEHQNGVAVSGGAPLPPTDEETAALEKSHEHEGDKLMRALGFEVVRFSHPGKTKQTPGIPDRRYYHRARRLAFWFEVKAEWGQQRPDQHVFQEMAEAVGEPYVLGTVGVLRTWLAGRRVCVFGVDNTPIPLPLEEQTP